MDRPPTRPRSSSRARQVAAVAFVGVCAGVLVMGRDHVYQDSTGPGPGFFPAWIGGLGLATGLLLLLIAHRPLGSAGGWAWPAGIQALRIYATVAATFAAGLALETLGFRVTLFAFITLLLRVYGVRSWVRIVALAAVATVAVHFVFNGLLKVLLPVGVLGI